MRRNSIYKINALSFVFLMLMIIGFVFVQGGWAQNTTGSAKFIAPRFNEPEVPINDSQEFTLDSPSEGENAQTPDSEETSSPQKTDASTTPTNAESPTQFSQNNDISNTKKTVAPSQTTAENGRVDKEPYDIYKENGHYFVDWEKPDVALIFTGMTNGYIEPCGCAGMERMKGGLSRRSTFLRELREGKGWDVVTIDTGQITVGFGVQEELKFDMAMNAFNLMDYDAIGIGKGELRFPAYFLLTFSAPTSSSNPSLFTSANIGVYGYHPSYTMPYKIVERGGKKIGITSVVCEDASLKRRDENLLFESPEKKLEELLPSLKKEQCDSLVLIVHGSEQETLQLAKRFPIFNYVVTSDTPSEPPAELRSIGKDQSMIEVGEKGKFAVVLGLYNDGSVRYQRVALDSRYESSAEITLLMKDYQAILKDLITTKGFRKGLGVNPARSPQAETLGRYVSSQKCRSCHEDAYKVWAKSRHAQAWKSLKETANPPRNYDPECISCHVVGWDGLQHFPYVDGYSSEKKTPSLLNVGCESCHGPGENHIAAELGDNEGQQERIRSAMRLGKNVKKVCYQCHDGDNSPSFDFDSYYPLIEHSTADDEEE